MDLNPGVEPWTESLHTGAQENPCHNSGVLFLLGCPVPTNMSPTQGIRGAFLVAGQSPALQMSGGDRWGHGTAGSGTAEARGREEAQIQQRRMQEPAEEHAGAHGAQQAQAQEGPFLQLPVAQALPVLSGPAPSPSAGSARSPFLLGEQAPSPCLRSWCRSQLDLVEKKASQV